MNEVASKLLMSVLLPVIQEALGALFERVSPKIQAWVYAKIDELYWYTKTTELEVDDKFALFMLSLFGRPTPTITTAADIAGKLDPSLLAQ